MQVQMSQRVSKTRMFWLSPHGGACGVSLDHLHLWSTFDANENLIEF